jgi:osmoprotectant transport system substrate-binding protein
MSRLRSSGRPCSRKYPAIRQTLGRVFATLSLNQLQVLNAQISVEGQQPRAVAMKYLQQKGLVR